MKIRSDIVRMYRDIHSWIGIISGLALFIAFYAGAITMFEVPLQRWASAPPATAAVPLQQTEVLVGKVLEEYPRAAGRYQVILQPGPETPARVQWSVRTPGADEHDPATSYYASLADDGSLSVTTEGPSGVAQLVDILHQQVGLPFRHEISMPIMGAIALMYFVALVSGLIVLLPTLVKDLFAFRIGKNLKRMWLDMHNVLGLFSLPFHIIMALTAVVFAFHDQFYDAQDAALFLGDESMFQAAPEEEPVSREGLSPLPLEALLARLEEQAPGFRPQFLEYHHDPEHGVELRVGGGDPAYGLRAATYGIAGVDAYTGEIIDTDYMPGSQGPWFATITSFFALHFGNFGGNTVRWSYFVLGLAGALLFYTGNLLWIEVHRRKRRGAAGEPVSQHAGARFLGALTVGVSLGCIAGISLTIAAAKLLPAWTADPERWHSILYYMVFLLSVVWAFCRGAARGGIELLWLSVLTTLCIPLVSLLSALVPGLGWNHADSYIVDLVAVAGAGTFAALAQRTRRRSISAPEDSIWYLGSAEATAAAAGESPALAQR